MNPILHTPLRALLIFFPALLLAGASCSEEPAREASQRSASDAQKAAAGAPGPSAADPVGSEPEASAGYEQASELQARDVLGADLQVGPHYRAQDEVVNDGAMNHFEIDSDYGRYVVDSQNMLIIRLHEIEAIAALKELSSAEVVADAAKEAAVKKVTAPVRGVKTGAHAVTHPGETWGKLSNASRGAMRVFGTASHRAQGHAENVADVAAGPEDAGSATRDSADQGADGTRRLARRYTSYGKEEREIMQELSINPYTDNEVLLDEVERVAGLGATVYVGFKFVPGIPGTAALDQINKAKKYSTSLALYEDPEALERHNRSLANQMGIPPAVYERFIANESYDPAMQTILVGAIHSLVDAKDKDNFFELAAEADSRSSAYFYTMIAQQLSEIHQDETPIVGLATGVKILAGVTKDGGLLVPLPVDHLAWTEEIAGIFRNSKQRVHEEDGIVPDYVELRIRGTVTPRARAGLEGMGMQVRSEVKA